MVVRSLKSDPESPGALPWICDGACLEQERWERERERQTEGERETDRQRERETEREPRETEAEGDRGQVCGVGPPWTGASSLGTT